MTIRRKVVLL
jgi:predicted PurR-regulated permease PerM